MLIAISCFLTCAGFTAVALIVLMNQTETTFWAAIGLFGCAGFCFIAGIIMYICGKHCERKEREIAERVHTEKTPIIV